jgi:phosphoglycerate dehydrogenase-like enzyme
MRQVALLMRQWPQRSHQELNALCETRLLMPGADLSGDFFRTFNSDVGILCSTYLDDITEALLDALPGLRLIAHFGTWRGTLTPFVERGIRVADSGPAGAGEAADFALAQLLAVRRRLMQPLIEAGPKRTLDQGLAASVSGLSVGLMGLDAVAGELAKRCRALDMRVLCWVPDDAGVPACAYVPAGAESLPSLEALVHESDALTLHGAAAATLLSAALLDQCRRDAVIVNVTDPALIDEPALIGALREYRIGGAALDVCHDAEALAQCPNTLLTPQLATNTIQAHLHMAERVIANVDAFLRNECLPDELLGTESL